MPGEFDLCLRVRLRRSGDKKYPAPINRYTLINKTGLVHAFNIDKPPQDKPVSQGIRDVHSTGEETAGWLSGE